MLLNTVWYNTGVCCCKLAPTLKPSVSKNSDGVLLYKQFWIMRQNKCRHIHLHATIFLSYHVFLFLFLCNISGTFDIAKVSIS